MSATTEPVLGAFPPPPPAERPRRWLVVLAVVWALILVVAASFAVRGDTATSRDQTTVAEARPYVDEAVARVATAAAATGGVVIVDGFDKVGDCDVSVVRGGQRYGRAVTVVVKPGAEADLLNRVAVALPASYRAAVRLQPTPRLTADAGFWVGLVGAVARPGEVRFFADTGDCRVPGDISTVDPAGAPGRTAVTDVLGRLGVTASEWSEAAVACPDGGVTGTVQAAVPAFTGALDARLPSAGTVVAGPKAVAYADGTAVRAHENELLVSATAICT